MGVKVFFLTPTFSLFFDAPNQPDLIYLHFQIGIVREQLIRDPIGHVYFPISTTLKALKFQLNFKKGEIQMSKLFELWK